MKLEALTEKPKTEGANADRAVAEARVDRKDGLRETVESIVIAFVLAFLFRTFEAEAFVIPTGSMAPTLMGRHKDLDCPTCGYRYQVNASDEIDDATGQPNYRVVADGIHRAQHVPVELASTTCPVCRFTTAVSRQSGATRSYPSYNGDRILAGKFPYQLGEPARWDVVVFKYPREAKVNYIKRLVGLPSETLRIHHGDIFTRPRGDREFAIERKPPDKIRAMMQVVYDNDYVVDRMIERGWPPRWRQLPAPSSADSNAWESPDGGRSFEISGRLASEAWLRYQHIVPSFEDWRAIRKGALPADYPRRPQLITDFCHYNTNQLSGLEPNTEMMGWHWVGDLLLECEIEVRGDGGEIVLELVEGNRPFTCRIDIASGRAALSIGGVRTFGPHANTSLRGKGTFNVAFSNFDDQLLLWVDERLVEFDAPTTHPAVPGTRKPGPADLAPLGIASRGAALRVNHLRVFRDVYYTVGMLSDFDHSRSGISRTLSHEGLVEFLSTSSAWDAFDHLQPSVPFTLDDDQFLCLGDNSPRSKDSRFWGPMANPEYFVRRDLLIGKALLVYWPHAWETHPSIRVPGTEIRVPFFPQVARMGSIR